MNNADFTKCVKLLYPDSECMVNVALLVKEDLEDFTDARDDVGYAHPDCRKARTHAAASVSVLAEFSEPEVFEKVIELIDVDEGIFKRVLREITLRNWTPPPRGLIRRAAANSNISRYRSLREMVLRESA